jgi:hypothetical protein
VALGPIVTSRNCTALTRINAEAQSPHASPVSLRSERRYDQTCLREAQTILQGLKGTLAKTCVREHRDNHAAHESEAMDMTLERAILLTVGSLVLISVLLAVYVDMRWLWLTGLLGAHLVQASFTGYCPVVRALKRMGLPSKAGFA